jgi:hypothetical protein
MEPVIETYTGVMFNFLDPKQEDIKIEDIAHSLSLQCRFTGHCKYFYSVAEHSVAVADLLIKKYGDRKLALAGLLHDASEAYLSDLASPWKQYLDHYDIVENNIEAHLDIKFGIDLRDKRIKEADIIMLSQEAHQLLPSKGDSWGWGENWGGRPELVEPVACLPPAMAKNLFLAWYKQLAAEPEILIAAG